MRKNLLVFCASLLVCISAFAQNQRVSGTVTAEDGTPVVGAAVYVKDMNQIGTVTNAQGQYNLSVPQNSTIVYSYLGMKNREEAVGTRTVINVQLESEALSMSTVVVTATGLTRAEKTLGYASTTVKSEDLIAGRSPSLMSGLYGKVAGMNVTSTGGTGTSQKVIIRGFSSLTGSNQPLYVIDGVPISNRFAGNADLNNTADFGTQINNINPEDVESVTVLKGASATALYGSRAANGVVMVTTKRGGKGEAVQVVYDASFMGSDILRVPVTQRDFGQGWSYDFNGGAGFGKNSFFGNWSPTENGSWGNRLDGRIHEWNIGAAQMGEADPIYKPYAYVPNSMRRFFDIGFEMNNNISVSGGTPNTGLVVSYGNSYVNGVLPGNQDYFKRNTFAFAGNTKINDGAVTVDYNISYAQKAVNNAMGGQGINGSTIFNNILQYPVDVDYRALQDYNSVYNNANNFYTPYAQNPWWINSHNSANYHEDLVYGRLETQVRIIPGLKAIGRIGGDFTNFRERYMNDILSPDPGSWNDEQGGRIEKGYYRERFTYISQIDANVLLNADYHIGDFSINGLAAWNLNQQKRGFTNSVVNDLIQPGWFNFQNSNSTPETTTNITDKRLIGLYAQGDFGYKGFAYMTISGRNDWSSTLPIDNNSFFYWSITGSLIITDMVPSIKSNTLNFLKVRAARGQVGNDAAPYQTGSPVYVKTNIGIPFGNIIFPLNGITGYTRSTQLPSSILQPEITTETEFGFNIRLFNSRITVDATYYNRNSKNQIMPVNIAPETGFLTGIRNVGLIRNRGVELMADFIPVQTRNFSWNLTYTFTKNVSRVMSLFEDSDLYPIYGLTTTPTLYAMKGQPLGIFLYDAPARVVTNRENTVVTEDQIGKIIVNSYGFPTTDASKKEVLGKSEPDFMMGFVNWVRYKNWSLGFTFDWRQGGIMYSNTKQQLTWNGNAPETTYNNRNGFIYPNSVYAYTVNQTVNGQVVSTTYYRENNIPVDIYTGGMNSYYNTSNNRLQFYNAMISRTFVKLREVNLTYSMPREWFRNFFVKGVDVSIVGRNLLMWTPSQGYIDPEITNFGNDLSSEWGEYNATPSFRTFGGAFKITF